MLPSWDSRCVKFLSLIGLAFNNPCPLANRTQTILKLHPNWEQINGKLFPNYSQSRHKEMRSSPWKQPLSTFQFRQRKKKTSPLFGWFIRDSQELKLLPHGCWEAIKKALLQAQCASWVKAALKAKKCRWHFMLCPQGPASLAVLHRENSQLPMSQGTAAPISNQGRIAPFAASSGAVFITVSPWALPLLRFLA